MKVESYKDSVLPPQENNQAREIEELSNFAFLGLIMCYANLYLLYLVFFGKFSNPEVMTGLHIWTALLMLLLFIDSFIWFSVGTRMVVRRTVCRVLLVSSTLVFILLHLSRYRIQS